MTKWFKSDARYIMASRDSYSTTEERTGRQWTDGKDIYRKVVDLGTLPNTTSKLVAHGITGLSKVISMAGMADNGAGVQYPIDYSDNTVVFISGSNISVSTTSDRTAYTAFLILEYTKT